MKQKLFETIQGDKIYYCLTGRRYIKLGFAISNIGDNKISSIIYYVSSKESNGFKVAKKQWSEPVDSSVNTVF